MVKKMIWDNIIEDSLNIDDYTGFVYEVVEQKTDKRYFGIKKFWKVVKYKPLKGRTNKRHITKETDWKNYMTSSPVMQEKLKSDRKNYKMYIKKLCKSVTEMKAWEAYYQLEYYVNNEWHKLYNEVINLRLRIR